MSDSMLTKDERARRGREIYERDIRADVEPDHDGEFLVVDVATGDYAVGKDDEEVFEHAEANRLEFGEPLLAVPDLLIASDHALTLLLWVRYRGCPVIATARP
jgi:hypothetical protein